MAWVPSIPFVTGSYPNQVIPSSDYNLLLQNAGDLQRAGRSLLNTGSISITQTTTGATWATIDQFTDPFLKLLDTTRPFILQATLNLAFSAVVANKAVFSIWNNSAMIGNVHFKQTADSTVRRLVVINKFLPVGSGNIIYLKWQMENATAVIATLTDGYRLTAIPI